MLAGWLAAALARSLAGETSLPQRGPHPICVREKWLTLRTGVHGGGPSQTEGTNNGVRNNHIFSRHACGGSNCNGSFISQFNGGDHDGRRVLGAPRHADTYYWYRRAAAER
jgi:hypothetical protein